MKAFIRPERLRRLCSAAFAPIFALSLLGGVGGCRHFYKPPPKDPEDLADYRAVNDPLEPFNRTMFGINMWAYHVALRPVGRAWKKYMPEMVRNSIANLNETWREPSVFFSAVGAGKPRRAGDSFMRFAINMSAGVAGFIDVAKYAGYRERATDPGMVLSSWGIPDGPYLFLPGMGPSNIRDASGYAMGQALTPVNYVPRGYDLISFNWGYNIMGNFNAFADQSDQLDRLEHQSLDPYAFLRSAWQQNRAAQIKAMEEDNEATVPIWYSVPKKAKAAQQDEEDRIILTSN